MNNTKFISFVAVSMGFLFYCYEYLLRISPSVMQHDIMAYFHIGATMFGTFGAFYYYAYTPMQICVGGIIDRYSTKNILLIFIIMCSAGTLLIPLTHSYYIAAFGRFLQGFASAFAWVTILKLGVVFLPRRFLGLISGIGSVFGFVGAAIGQTIMGYTTQEYGWLTVLNTLSIMGIPLAIIIYVVIFYVERRLDIKHEPHVTHGHALRWWFNSLLIIIKTPQAWHAGIIAALLFLPTTVFAELWGVDYIVNVYQYNTSQASFIVGLIFIGWAIGSFVVGLISAFITNRILVIRIGAALALVFCIIMLYVKVSFFMLCVLTMLFGICSAVEVLTFPMGMLVFDKKIAATAAAFVNFLCMSSGMIFQRFAGQLLDLYWSGKTANGIRVYAVTEYKLAMCIVPIAIAICVIYTFFIKNDDNNLAQQDV